MIGHSPLRWALRAVAFGFCGALASRAFEFDKEAAGLDHDTKAELVDLRAEVDRLRWESVLGLSVANTTESLLRAERATR